MAKTTKTKDIVKDITTKLKKEIVTSPKDVLKALNLDDIIAKDDNKKDISVGDLLEGVPEKKRTGLSAALAESFVNSEILQQNILVEIGKLIPGNFDPVEELKPVIPAVKTKVKPKIILPLPPVRPTTTIIPLTPVIPKPPIIPDPPLPGPNPIPHPRPIGPDPVKPLIIKPEVTIKPKPDILVKPDVTIKPKPDILVKPEVTIKPKPDILVKPEVTIKPKPDILVKPEVTIKPKPDILVRPESISRVRPKIIPVIDVTGNLELQLAEVQRIRKSLPKNATKAEKKAAANAEQQIKNLMKAAKRAEPKAKKATFKKAKKAKK